MTSLQSQRPNRNLYMDAIRGVFLVHMTMSHLTPPRWIGFSTLGFLSAADGFFVLAGLLLGKIYLPKFRNEPGSARMALIKRSGQLFAANIFISLAVHFVEFLAGKGELVFPSNAVAILFGRHTWMPPYFDAILAIYAMAFLALASFGPWLVRYPKQSLAVSTGFWVFGLLIPIAGNSEPYFSLLSWQFYLLGGALVAFLHNREPAFGKTMLSISIVGLAGLFTLRHLEEFAHLVGIQAGNALLQSIEFLGNKRSIGPLRILDVAFAGLAILAFRPWLEPVLLRLGLHRIGKVSLQVFVFQGVVTPILAPYCAFLVFPLEYVLWLVVWGTLLVFAQVLLAIRKPRPVRN